MTYRLFLFSPSSSLLNYSRRRGRGRREPSGKSPHFFASEASEASADGHRDADTDADAEAEEADEADEAEEYYAEDEWGEEEAEVP